MLNGTGGIVPVASGLLESHKKRNAPAHLRLIDISYNPLYSEAVDSWWCTSRRSYENEFIRVLPEQLIQRNSEFLNTRPSEERWSLQLPVDTVEGIVDECPSRNVVVPGVIWIKADDVDVSEGRIGACIRGTALDSQRKPQMGTRVGENGMYLIP